MHSVLPKNLLLEFLLAIPLVIYVMIVVLVVTRLTYNLMRSKGLSHEVSVYYNRKLIHVFVGGLIALVVPYIFASPIVPAILAIALGMVLYVPHRLHRIWYWFQVENNMYEVNFSIAWGASLFILWYLFNSPIYAVLPLTFMSFGDAVTGFIRNYAYRRRTKSWLGNLGMLVITLPIGYVLAGGVGVAAAIIASIIEHFEFPPLFDDNVLIACSTIFVLIIGRAFALI